MIALAIVLGIIGVFLAVFGHKRVAADPTGDTTIGQLGKKLMVIGVVLTLFGFGFAIAFSLI